MYGWHVQLIITIEFTAAIKLKSITVVGSTETDSNPADMKAFLNRDDVDFDNVEDLDPVQVCFCATIPTAALVVVWRGSWPGTVCGPGVDPAGEKRRATRVPHELCKVSERPDARAVLPFQPRGGRDEAAVSRCVVCAAACH